MPPFTVSEVAVPWNSRSQERGRLVPRILSTYGGRAHLIRGHTRFFFSRLAVLPRAPPLSPESLLLSTKIVQRGRFC